MRTRLRRAVAVATMAIAATVVTSTIGGGQADALTGWTPYSVIAQTQATVGSVTATAQIRRGTALNTYYTKVTCDNTNPAWTVVRVASGYSWSQNIQASLGHVYIGPWDLTTSVSYSDPFIAFNDYLQVFGTCEYFYDRDLPGHYGWVTTPWSAWVWVGYWTG